jgi:hypothetical protein
MNAHPLFDVLAMQPVTADTLDTMLVDDTLVRILFLWGHDCPNCDIAKTAMLDALDDLRWPDVRWLQANAYDDPAVAIRFGLHGIPAFLVFRGARTIGRISPWPGRDAFVAAIERVRNS